MKHVEGSSPKTFNCSSDEVEEITIEFTPIPDNCLGEIRFCFDDACDEADQEVVDGDELSFEVDANRKKISLFFFFIPPAPGEALGRCKIKLSSSNDDEFDDPRTVKESGAGVPFSQRLYIFKRV